MQDKANNHTQRSIISQTEIDGVLYAAAQLQDAGRTVHAGTPGGYRTPAVTIGSDPNNARGLPAFVVSRNSMNSSASSTAENATDYRRRILKSGDTIVIAVHKLSNGTGGNVVAAGEQPKITPGLHRFNALHGVHAKLTVHISEMHRDDGGEAARGAWSQPFNRLLTQLDGGQELTLCTPRPTDSASVFGTAAKPTSAQLCELAMQRRQQEAHQASSNRHFYTDVELHEGKISGQMECKTTTLSAGDTVYIPKGMICKTRPPPRQPPRRLRPALRPPKQTTYPQTKRWRCAMPSVHCCTGQIR